MTSCSWPEGKGRREGNKSDYDQANGNWSDKFLRPQSEAALQRLRKTPIPCQIHKWPQPCSRDMDEQSYSSFSLCEDHDYDYDCDYERGHGHYQTPDPPPSFNTSIFLTAGDNSAYGSDNHEIPVSHRHEAQLALTGGDTSSNSNTNNNNKNKKRNKRPPQPLLPSMKAKLRKITTLHSDVMAKRTGMREQRAELGCRREEELQQRVALMKTVNAFCAQVDCGDGGAQQDMQMQIQTIELGHDQLQSVMNAYMELERKYDAEEDELRRREDELDVAVERVSSWVQDSDVAEGVQYHDDDDDDDDDDVDEQDIDTNDSEGKDDEDDEYGDDEMFAEDMHPLMVEYLQRMGDIELCEERLEEVEGEHEDILNKQELRNRVNVPLDEESRKFLSSYKEQREKAQKALDTTIHEANRLHELCKSEGLLHNNTGDTIANNDNTNNENADDDDDDDDDEIGLSQAIHNHQHDHPDPLKATAEEDTQPFFEPQTSTSASNSTSTNTPGGSKFNRSTFINKWLLHQLRHSSLQISRLKALPELHGLGYDASAISQQALDVWFLDDAAMAEPPASSAVTENANAGVGTGVSPTVAGIAEEKQDVVVDHHHHHHHHHHQGKPDEGRVPSRRRSDPVRGAKRDWDSMRRARSCIIL